MSRQPARARQILTRKTKCDSNRAKRFRYSLSDWYKIELVNFAQHSLCFARHARADWGPYGYASFRERRSLKLNFQDELDGSRWNRGVDRPAERWEFEDSYRNSELRVIQTVERLGPELSVNRLGH